MSGPARRRQTSVGRTILLPSYKARPWLKYQICIVLQKVVTSNCAQSIVEASISDLQHALSTGSITSVELLAKYLLRIFTYDCRGPCLNSIPILNPDVFEEAAASDARRQAGELRGPLDGIPYTIKDSMKYKGQTCATGSPAFKNFVANEDSFIAEVLRKAGAISIGRTNTPPMMASGMHRGEYGRAGSPYNPECACVRRRGRAYVFEPNKTWANCYDVRSDRSVFVWFVERLRNIDSSELCCFWAW